MFRRSLTTHTSSHSRLLRHASTTARASSLLPAMSSAFVFPPSASIASRGFSTGPIRCYENASDGHVIKPSELKHDWADKGPVPFEEMREISKRAGRSTDVMILDVRELAEIQQGNIPSSLPLPLSILDEALKLDPMAWEKRLGFKKPGRDQPIVVYCRSGKRSQSALDKMTGEISVEDRFTNVRNFVGSWNEWSEKYKPTKEEIEDDD